MGIRISIALMTLISMSQCVFAARVEYRIDVSEIEGTFQLFASSSLEDNAGIAAYSVALQGPITSVNHLSPYSIDAQNISSESGAAGFSLFRSPNGSLIVHASQDTIADTSHLIYGMGQTANSFQNLGLSTSTQVKSPTWGGEFLLATGTYSPQLGAIAIDLSSNNTQANAFHALGSSSVFAADIVGKPQQAPMAPSDPLPPVVIPPTVEPPVIELPTAPELTPVIELPPLPDPPVVDPPATPTEPEIVDIEPSVSVLFPFWDLRQRLIDIRVDGTIEDIDVNIDLHPGLIPTQVGRIADWRSVVDLTDFDGLLSMSDLSTRLFTGQLLFTTGIESSIALNGMDHDGALLAHAASSSQIPEPATAALTAFALLALAAARRR
jgi:hypothetical protein